MPLNITQYRRITDEVLCTAFTEITVTNSSHPYVYSISIFIISLDEMLMLIG